MSVVRTLALAPDVSVGKLSIPDWPLGWYVVARSADIPSARILTVELSGRECVVFRTEGGTLVALDAHCPHMGAHLRHGKVVGEQIRCALHGFSINAQGEVGAAITCDRSRTWRVAERFGLVFIGLGVRESLDPPEPNGARELIWTTGGPEDIRADWRSMAVNSFDMRHLCTIHHRELVAPIETGRDECRVYLRYISRVTGSSLSDRLMKWLSKDRIRVQMSCFGAIIFAETDLGFTSTAAVLGMLPTRNGLRAFGAFGIRPGPFGAFRLWVARSLFMAFLRRDFKIVEDMALRADDRDPGLSALLQFLRQLAGSEP